MKRKLFSALILLGGFFYLLIPNISSFIEAANIKIDTTNIDTYFSTLQKNIVDSLGDSNEITVADNTLTYYLSGQITSTQVVLGKDEYLFYKTTADGNPIKDYEGTDLMDQEHLDGNINRIKELENFFYARGAQFAYIILPNKEVVYSQYMPSTYTMASTRKTPEFVEYAKQQGIDIIYPEQELIDLSKEYETYYKYDTHWNEIGGYLGACKVLEYFGLEYEDIHERTIYYTGLSGNIHISAKQDLLRMAGLESVLTDGLNPHISGTNTTIQWDKIETQQNTTYSHITNLNAKYDQTLLLVGDSFRIAMIPYLSENFRDVYFYHRDHYKESEVDTISPDYVVFECVDRYSEVISILYRN